MSSKLALLLALSLLTHGQGARADEKSVCLRAAEAGQSLRGQGKLIDARSRFLVCASDTCPPVVRDDCAHWLDAVDRDMPTIAVRASEGGEDVTDVYVACDDQPLVTHLDGKAVSVDPGPHTFRFVHQGRTREERLVISEGDKNRQVIVHFELPEKAVVLSPMAPLPRRSSRVGPFVLGAVGLVALGGSVFLGVLGSSDLSGLRASCAPGCNDSQVDPVKREVIAADVLLGVSAVSLAAAVVWFASAPRAAPVVGTLRGGLLSGSF